MPVVLKLENMHTSPLRHFIQEMLLLSNVKQQNSKTVYSGRALDLRIATIKKRNGRLTTREIVDHPDSVAIVAIDQSENALLVQQYREGANKELLEIPAGGLEPGELPEECVNRELREETGYFPHHIERIGGFYTAPGFCTEYLHLYLATELEYNPLYASDTDEIHVSRVPLFQVIKLIASGRIEDIKTIAGLLTVLTSRYNTGRETST